MMGRLLPHSAALAAALTLLPACSATVEGNPQAAERMTVATSAPANPAGIASILPDAVELSRVFTSGADDIDPFIGDASDLRDTMIGQDVSGSQCIGTVSPLERHTYTAALVQEVAYATLPDATFGALAFPSAADAHTFFDTAVNQWLACNGKTVIESSVADTYSRTISDVNATADVVSAVVGTSTRSTARQSRSGRALGVAENYIVDVQLWTSEPVLAVALAQLMMSKVPARQ